jgi:transcriptional regulator with XRE-family HTH domain
MDISELIKITRKNLNMNQADFGKALGRTRSAVANWETGLNRPDRYDAVQWSMLYSDWRKDLGLSLLVEYRKEG